MLRILATMALLGAGGIAACSPTFNWREVRVQSTPLTAMMPCKPDTGAREMPMAGRKVNLTALSCEAGGATFALLFAEVGETARMGEVLLQWNLASLGNLRGAAARDRPFRPPGALALPQSMQVLATGQRTNGNKVESHAAYFAHGTHVYQAVIYATSLKPEVAETFFSGLKFQ